MEEEKKVSEEKEVKLPNVNPYKKDRGDDAEVEAFQDGLERREAHFDKVVRPFRAAQA